MTPRAWLGVALFCGLAPLALGVAIFALWLPTRWELLTSAGLLTMIGGTCLFPVGLGGLWASKVRDRRALFALLLLILNFPTSWSIAFGVVRLRSRFAVEIDNRSGRPLDAATVLSKAPLARHVDIPSGARRILRFSLPAEGAIRYRIELGDKVFEGEIEGYVDPSQGGDWRLIVTPEGVRVEDLRRPFR